MEVKVLRTVRSINGRWGMQVITCIPDLEVDDLGAFALPDTTVVPRGQASGVDVYEVVPHEGYVVVFQAGEAFSSDPAVRSFRMGLQGHQHVSLLTGPVGARYKLYGYRRRSHRWFELTPDGVRVLEPYQVVLKEDDSR